MTQQTNSGQPSRAELLARIASLEKQVAELAQDKEDLEILLETTTEHSDTVEDELHQRAEDALRKSEQQLRMIIEATPAPVIISRLSDGKIRYANAITGELFGLSTTTLLDHHAGDLFYDSTEFATLLTDLHSQQMVNRYEVCFKRLDGTPIWGELSLRPLEFNDEPAVLAALHDISHLKALNQATNRFVPQQYLGFLNKESITDVNLGDYVTGEMTVMFSDLRGFTTLSEKMSPKDNFTFINEYFRQVCPAIYQHQGFVIKYLGDGIHAIFPQQADHGVQAGIAKLKQVNKFNEYRLDHDQFPIAIGIGVNTGYMMVGMVGEAHRLQGDALSDDVNLAARLEGLTKFYGISFIISSATYRQLADPSRYSIRYVDRVQVKGRTTPLDLYEVYDADPAYLRELKQETQAEYEEALSYYYAQDFEAAQAKLFHILQRNSRDKVAWHHLVNATRFVDSGAPEGWTGVTVMTKK